MSIKIGNSAKDSQYLKRIKKAIEGDKGHPRHNGVQMQAHHAISAEGMRLSGLGEQIKKLGYDINLLPNLAFIPCTLQGACYLGVQPHRGNHTAFVSQDDYIDDEEPIDYHRMVALRLRDLSLPLSKECPGDSKVKREEVQVKLDKLSGLIFGFIQNRPSEAPLKNIASNFDSNNFIGCGGVDFIPLHKNSTPCPVERNHHGKQAAGQNSEDITYVKNGKYKLKSER